MNTELTPKPSTTEVSLQERAAVKRAIKAGDRDIPGLRIYQESSVTVR